MKLSLTISDEQAKIVAYLIKDDDVEGYFQRQMDEKIENLLKINYTLLKTVQEIQTELSTKVDDETKKN